MYLPILLHHQYQKNPYPAIGIQFWEIEDIDVDNSRLLAILDVFDTIAFGRPSVKIYPLSLEKCREELLNQFRDEKDEEVIDFLIKQYEKINNLV